MRKPSAFGICLLMLAGCQTSGTSFLPSSQETWFDMYSGRSNDFKAYVMAESNFNPFEHAYHGQCHGMKTVESAILCATEMCESKVATSRYSHQYTSGCKVYAIGDAIVGGRSEAQITAAINQYQRTGKNVISRQEKISEPVQAVSLDEAKKISTEFEKKAHVAPPRSISDITTILDQQRIKFPEAITHQIALVDTEPSSSSDSKLANFYHKRGIAALSLGLLNQALADARLSYHHAAEAGSRRFTYQGRSLNLRQATESSFGNFKTAINVINEFLDRQNLTPESEVIALISLVDSYIQRGNIFLAEKFSNDAEEIITSELKDSTRMAQVPVAKLVLKVARSRLTYSLHNAQGNYTIAEKYIYEYLSLYQQLRLKFPEAPHSRIYLWQGKLGTNLKNQGRLLEAEVVARDALVSALRDTGKANHRVGEIALVLADILVAQERFEDAAKLTQAIINIYATMKMPFKSVTSGKARFQLAQSLVWQGKHGEALVLFDDVQRTLVDAQEIVRQWFKNTEAYPLAMIKSGRANDAIRFLQPLITNHSKMFGHQPHRLAVSQGLLGMALAGQGNVDKAINAFQPAIPVLMASSKLTNGQLHKWIMESYMQTLIKSWRKTGDRSKLEESFQISDAIRSKSVQSAVTASGARAAAGNKELADYVRRLQDADRQFFALSDLLGNALSAPTDQQDAKAVKDLRGNVRKLDSARKALSAEIKTRFPEYGELVNPKPKSVATVRQHLRRNEAMLSFYSDDNLTHVWALPKSGPVAYHAAPIGKKRLHTVVRELRKALDPSAETLGDIPPFNVSLSHRLYKLLLAPVQKSWQSANSLLITSHGVISQLPFSLLVAKSKNLGPEKAPLFSNYRAIPWLANTHAVTILPSVTSLVSLRSQPAPNPSRRPFAGFGDPYFSTAQAVNDNGSTQTAALTSRGLFKVRGLKIKLRSAPKTQKLNSADLAKLPRLPDTADEIRSIAKAMNADLKRHVFIGRKATEEAVKTLDLSQYRVLAFATHGLVPGDLDGLRQPALALSTPKLGNTKGDGLLTMGEILGLKLDADWVVLSACNTGASDGAGAEAFSGLGRAFFYAGTRAVLLSNWPVETTSAKLLTTDLFRSQAKASSLTRAQALRKSMLSMIKGKGLVDPKTGKTVFSYAHPIFWAPFSLVGDGDGGKPAS